MGGIRNQRTVLGLVAAVLASAGLVLALDGDDPDGRTVGAVAPLARPVATTTPPEVLGDVVVRVPVGEQAEDAQVAPEQLATTSPAPVATASPTTSLPPPPAPPPPTPPATSAPAPPPTAAPTATTTTTTEPAAPAATVELQREADGRPLQVDLLRDGARVGGGMLDDVLRFEDLPAGPYELLVSWNTGVLVDEENGTAISGSGIARHAIDARAGETTVIRCGELECEVP